ncbi:carbonic anhydrase 4-like isoform X2 [Hypomesus transpacificus]|uniref:carbonic anhydrase 4-like isoform X2 n=1 Tax=Hypomesus transpacificus TaxID=137520 RepID=UPI001F071378|nr:carbonic anhydrase 4-like isoform X2 [Hypomesus transpacificus]
MDYLTNTGHSVMCVLKEGLVEVRGGGLSGTYLPLQIKFHWGDTDLQPGSEHTVDGHRYPMEMHIVSVKKELSMDEVLGHPEGLAVFGFFINVTEDWASSSAWENFTSYFSNLTETDSVVELHHNMSINDLLAGVDLTRFYRYLGSLTTPTCDEAVVWTVFQEPIRISRELMVKFPKNINLTNIYRPTQPLNQRVVSASPAVTPTPASLHSDWCYDDKCSFSPSLWSQIPDSHCGGDNQSPVNIVEDQVMVDRMLQDFIFDHFDDQRAIKHLVNTGHSVKCVLHDDLVSLSGGGLGYKYTTLQFHFHWGTTDQQTLGSEHTLNSKRFPMVMHVVSQRSDLTLEEAKQTFNGFAVLGFFLEGREEAVPSPGTPNSHKISNDNSDAWMKLTSYLSAVSNISTTVEVTHNISLDDLLGDVDRKTFYRYNGSLTTPPCNEAVVWTIFKHPVKVDKDLMKRFPTYAGFTNVFRPQQPLRSRTIYTKAAAPNLRPPATPLLLLLLLAWPGTLLG